MVGKLIPDIVVGRLPVYLRALQRMTNEGRNVTSSQELGERLGISAAQIRKDLSQFGEFGKQGTGYDIQFLAEQISSILHLDQVWDMVVVGAGDIGHALARYQGFADRGFRVTLIFDNDSAKVGNKIGAFFIQSVDNLAKEIEKNHIKVGMISVPAEHAQEVADKMVDAGIKAILNYAPINLNVPPEVRVQDIDPVTHLQHMTYYL